MKVLHICVNFYHGLFHQFVKKIAEYDIDQIIYYPLQKKWDIRLDFDEYPNINYLPSPILNFYTRVSYYHKKRKVLKDIVDKVAFNEINIIHAHTLFSDGGIAYELFLKYNIPYIVAIRQSDFIIIKYKPWLLNYGLKILNNANRIICISPQMVKQVETRFGINFKGKINIISNAINSNYLLNDKSKTKGKKAPIKLLYVGSFLKRKNLHKLINFVESNNGLYELIIVGGKGDFVKYIIDLINKSKYVTYKGEIFDDKLLIKEYILADIFILPSINETFGISYIEAISQGTPILFSRNTGIDGFFKEGEVGYSINPYDSLDWEESIRKILKNYTSLSRNCIKAAKDFNWDIIGDKYLNIYKKIY